jgi:DNA-3-methyladenine glycosylase II
MAKTAAGKAPSGDAHVHRRAVAHLRASDPVMAAIIDRVGPAKITPRLANFWSLARAIVFQQLNGKAALTIWNRLEAAAGGEVTPESILKLTEAEMRACGLSRQKLSYVRDLAARTASGEIDFARLPSCSDEEVIEHLTRVKGVGTWTAQMFLIFALNRPDVLPTADFGVRAAIKKAYRLRKMPTPKRMEQIARSWRPYCSVACWYLWRSLDTTV